MCTDSRRPAHSIGTATNGIHVTAAYFGFEQAFVAAEVVCGVLLFTVLRAGRWGALPGDPIENVRQAVVITLGISTAALAAYCLLTTAEGYQLHQYILANQRRVLVSVVVAASMPRVLDAAIHYIATVTRP